MPNRIIACVLAVLAMSLVLVQPAHAAQPARVPAPAVTPEPCGASDKAFELPGGARGLVCKPREGWIGDVIVYAHGYVDPTVTERVFANLDLPQPDGSVLSLPDFAQTFGYAFAATTYRRNGLAVQEGVDDLRELIAALPAKLGAKPKRIFVFGVSEGGQIATLFVERNPLASDGLLAACAPIGSFQRESQYLGDFRLLFNAYFPDVLPADPNDPVKVPAELIANWQSVYVPKVTQALADQPTVAGQLITDANAAIDQTQPASVLSTTLELLFYNVFSTNDTRAQLGGNPYDSSALRARFPDRNLPLITADITATKALTAYETTGKISIPVITAHTTGDPLVPIWQQQLYATKTLGNGFATHRTYAAYGHCAFSGSDLLGAFTELARQGGNLRRLYVPLGQGVTPTRR